MSENANGAALNGASAAPPNLVQINPMQAAAFALTFLARADMKPHEREAYGIAEGLLQAIASGRVALASPELVPANQASDEPMPRRDADTRAPAIPRKR